MSTNHKEHKDCLAPSPILDYESSLIQGVLSDLKKAGGIIEQRIAAYLFVRDRIIFGYNPDRDSIPASQVLRDGIGHCNTKAPFSVLCCEGWGYLAVSISSRSIKSGRMGTWKNGDAGKKVTKPYPINCKPIFARNGFSLFHREPHAGGLICNRLHSSLSDIRNSLTAQKQKRLLAFTFRCCFSLENIFSI